MSRTPGQTDSANIVRVPHRATAKLTPEVEEQILQIYRIFPRHGALTVASMWTGINMHTISQWRSRYPQFREKLRRAQAENLMRIQSRLVQAATGDPKNSSTITALIFYARTSWPKIYAIDKNAELLAASMAADAIKERTKRLEKILEEMLGAEKATEIISRLADPKTIRGTYRTIEEEEKEEDDDDEKQVLAEEKKDESYKRVDEKPMR